METTKLSSKGQLVIPKRVRDAVQAKIGTLFSVRGEGRRIVLETARKKERKLADWPGLNPAGVKLSTSELSKPVALGPNDGRR